MSRRRWKPPIRPASTRGASRRGVGARTADGVGDGDAGDLRSSSWMAASAAPRASRVTERWADVEPFAGRSAPSCRRPGRVWGARRRAVRQDGPVKRRRGGDDDGRVGGVRQREDAEDADRPYLETVARLKPARQSRSPQHSRRMARAPRRAAATMMVRDGDDGGTGWRRWRRRRWWWRRRRRRWRRIVRGRGRRVGGRSLGGRLRGRGIII